MTDISPASSNLSHCFEQHLLSVTNSDIKPAQVNGLWQDIAIRYNELRRAYHTLEHLQQLFSQFEQIKHKLQQPSIIALALFYHDVIYEPTRADNELKSADYAQKVLSQYLTDAQVEGIYKLIIMTADHQLNDADISDPSSSNNSDAAYLLDMDLSVLGAAWSEYEQYAKAVRQEYSHVAEAKYRMGRTEVLAGLLAHPRLYFSDYYYQRLEVQARENIGREITSLIV